MIYLLYIISQQKSEPNLESCVTKRTNPADKKNNGVNEARESRRRTDQPTAAQLNLRTRSTCSKPSHPPKP